MSVPHAVLSALLAVLAAAPSPAADGKGEVRTIEIGAPAPDFDLPGVDGRRHRLADFAAAKVLIVVFTCNHCPTAQAYEGRIAKLHEDYKDKGAALVAISPNDPLAVRLDELGYTDLGDSFEDMQLRAKDRGFRFPYLYDGETQTVSRAYGVMATPHVFIFDSERKLRYVGRVDDAEVKAVKSHDARDAIEALLEGRQVPVATTRVFGCSTKWAGKREDAKRSLARWDEEPVDLKPIRAAAAKDLARNDGKKLRLVNVWATYCGPCIVELPELVTANRMYRGREFETITISIDGADRKEKALEALKKAKVSSTNYILEEDSRDALADALDPKWQGPLPHTILIAPGGKVIYRKTGAFDALELKRAIVGFLGRTY
jgi:peroxiredoxin